MSPTQYLSTTLQSLPTAVRKTLYTTFALLGLLLGLCQLLDVATIAGVSMMKALQVYAYLAPVSGFVAVANVGQHDAEIDPGYYAEEDVDLSSYEPVGNPEAVYS